MFINKIRIRSLINLNSKRRNYFQNMFTSRCNCYVTFLFADNTLSNSFKYTHPRKSLSNFGSMNMKSFYGNIVSFKV